MLLISAQNVCHGKHSMDHQQVLEHEVEKLILRDVIGKMRQTVIIQNHISYGVVDDDSG